jgi:RNA-directed DNA polymerase
VKARALPRSADAAPDLWAQVRSFANLHAAWRAARLGKRNRTAVARFAFDLEGELFALQQALDDGSYRHGAYRQFTLYERKPRLISAAPFRDRVVHHALIRVVEPLLDAGFSPFSFACRTGKGVHAAANHYQCLAGRHAYVLKLDVAGYFPSIHQGVVLAQLERRIADVRVLDLFHEVLASYASERGEGRGLPIGNLTSQVLANVHLDDLDHFIVEQLHVPGYLRYVDDLFLLHDCKAALWQAAEVIEAHLQGLGLALKPAATRMRRTSERVDVLGYLVTRNRRWLRNENGYRYRRRLRGLAQAYARGEIGLKDVRASVNAWVGHAKHADSRGLRQTVLGGVRFVRPTA